MNRHGGYFYALLQLIPLKLFALVVYFCLLAKNSSMKVIKIAIGFIIGCINSLLGAGGGMLAVPYLCKEGLSQQSAQASSTFIILPFSILSTLLYLKSNAYSLSSAWIFLPAGAFGAVLGGIFLKKIPSRLLKLVFSAFMLYAGIRMLIK